MGAVCERRRIWADTNPPISDNAITRTRRTLRDHSAKSTGSLGEVCGPIRWLSVARDAYVNVMSIEHSFCGLDARHARWPNCSVIWPGVHLGFRPCQTNVPEKIHSPYPYPCFGNLNMLRPDDPKFCTNLFSPIAGGTGGFRSPTQVFLMSSLNAWSYRAEHLRLCRQDRCAQGGEKKILAGSGQVTRTAHMTWLRKSLSHTTFTIFFLHLSLKNRLVKRHSSVVSTACLRPLVGEMTENGVKPRNSCVPTYPWACRV